MGYYLLMILLIAADQLTKFLVVKYVKQAGTLPIIKDIFHFTYVENTGAAFGILKGRMWLFFTITAITLAAVLFFLARRPIDAPFFLAGISIMGAGAIGNFIDRLTRGYVVDFLEVRFVKFAVFNLADMLITIGTIMIGIYVLFFMDESDSLG